MFDLFLWVCVGFIFEDNFPKGLNVHISKLPAFPCMTLKIFRNGTMLVYNAAASVHSSPTENLRIVLSNTVRGLGPFKCDVNALYQTTDNPICHHASNTHSRMHKPIIGYSDCTICDHMILLPFHNNQKQAKLDSILTSKDPYKWKDKIDRAVWHGTHTGHVEFNKLYVPHMIRTPRQEIVAQAKSNPHLDASFHKIPWTDMLRYKFIVAVSGNSCSSLLKHALASSSCVLRQNSMAVEWYEQFLIPWKHYVPVKYDLSDLREKIDWALNNDAACEQIAREATNFTRTYFNVKAVSTYIWRTLAEECGE